MLPAQPGTHNMWVSLFLEDPSTGSGSFSTPSEDALPPTIRIPLLPFCFQVLVSRKQAAAWPQSPRGLQHPDGFWVLLSLTSAELTPRSPWVISQCLLLSTPRDHLLRRSSNNSTNAPEHRSPGTSRGPGLPWVDARAVLHPHLGWW